MWVRRSKLLWTVTSTGCGCAPGSCNPALRKRSPASDAGPVIRQTTLEGTSTLVQGKPLVLGSLDVPGSTRHQEVEVVSELVR